MLATVLLLTLSLVPVPSQSASGSIAGRVTAGPRRATVLLFRKTDLMREPRAVARTRADGEGRYRFDGLAAGEYVVVPVAPGFSGSLEWVYGVTGRSVTLGEGEEATADLALERGGVVTGRVTDANGRPVVNESVTLTRVDADGGEPSPVVTEFWHRLTDDRGVYRLFGISPGRYLVSVGQDPDPQQGAARSFRAGWYAKTYHPAAATQTDAVAVEVTAGGEATGVDVVVGRRARNYGARGRVVEAGTGKPIPGAMVGYGPLFGGSEGARVRGQSMMTRTDDRGEFSFDNLGSGRYAALIGSGTPGPAVWYADPVPFEVTDGDVSGLELRARRGVTVSGTVVLEGTDDPAVRAGLAKLSVAGAVAEDESAAVQYPSWYRSRVEPDGTFALTGVRPGALTISLPMRDGPKGFSLVRVERDGVPVAGATTIAPGEDVAGLRVVVAYGTGVIRGTVEASGPEAPSLERGSVSLVRAGTKNTMNYTQPDARGQFRFEGIAAGDYELHVRLFTKGKMWYAKQQVSVGDGETSVTVTVAPAGEERQ